MWGAFPLSVVANSPRLFAFALFCAIVVSARAVRLVARLPTIVPAIVVAVIATVIAAVITTVVVSIVMARFPLAVAVLAVLVVVVVVALTRTTLTPMRIHFATLLGRDAMKR